MKLEYSVEEPLNREPSIHALVQSFLSLDHQYDRNHGPIPYIKADEHFVVVDGNVHNHLKLSIDDLKFLFPQHEMICALQCAGNRRHTMRTRLKEVNGIDWGDAAVMNCVWKGPKLRDILQKADLAVTDTGDQHVAFACFQTSVQGQDWYGGSIELHRAMDTNADIILALEMNGKVLTATHGYPVRILVPGVSGCRSVKWLDRITVQFEESTNIYQRYDYKKLPPEAIDTQSAEKFWDVTPALQDMPVNSAIAEPQDGDTVQLSPAGTIRVRGYALPQGSQGPVVKVEVSINDGRTWTEAKILCNETPPNKWSWVLWTAMIRIEKGQKRQIFSRATDAGGNVQNDHPGKWNLRGVGYDGFGEAKDIKVI